MYLLYICNMDFKLDDIKRVFEYHGAEHKSIHCYENEEELTVENIKKISYFTWKMWYKFSIYGYDS